MPDPEPAPARLRPAQSRQPGGYAARPPGRPDLDPAELYPDGDPGGEPLRPARGAAVPSTAQTPGEPPEPARRHLAPMGGDSAPAPLYAVHPAGGQLPDPVPPALSRPARPYPEPAGRHPPARRRLHPHGGDRRPAPAPGLAPGGAPPGGAARHGAGDRDDGAELPGPALAGPLADGGRLGTGSPAFLGLHPLLPALRRPAAPLRAARAARQLLRLLCQRGGLHGARW